MVDIHGYPQLAYADVREAEVREKLRDAVHMLNSGKKSIGVMYYSGLEAAGRSNRRLVMQHTL